MDVSVYSISYTVCMPLKADSEIKADTVWNTSV